VASKGMTEDGQKRTVGLESQSKYWATPDCNTSTYSNGMKGPNPREQSSKWPTPMAGMGENSHGQISGDFRRNMDLILTDNWPTPRGTDGTKGGPNQAGSKGDLMLPSAAAQWPTPDAAMHGGSNTSQGPAGSRPNITLAAQQWPTPAARDYRSESGGGAS
ncbi:hypothetical protein P3G55_26790, partial [Leptospira sp. 96542]|nr:hypothetical protein [Leptospira sp. 96542]